MASAQTNLPERRSAPSSRPDAQRAWSRRLGRRFRAGDLAGPTWACLRSRESPFAAERRWPLCERLGLPRSPCGRSLTGCRFGASWSSDRTSARSVLRCRCADGTVLAAKRGTTRCSSRQGRRGIDRRDPGSEPRRLLPARCRGWAAAARRSHPRPRGALPAFHGIRRGPHRA